MTWDFDYETVNAARACHTEEYIEQMELALRDAKAHFASQDDEDYVVNQDDEDYIVIQVEGYSCIALVTDEFWPIEVHQDIFAFDEERTYPMQGLVIKPQFWRPGDDL